MIDPVEPVRRFIAAKNEDRTEFKDHDDLIENGLIDSLRFVEFVLLIEELSGRVVDLANVNIDDFRSVDAIRSAYFGGASAELAGSK